MIEKDEAMGHILTCAWSEGMSAGSLGGPRPALARADVGDVPSIGRTDGAGDLLSTPPHRSSRASRSYNPSNSGVAASRSGGGV